MARTVNGNLTGKAAQIQKAEDRTEAILAQLRPIQVDEQKQQKRIEDLMQACYDIEGETFIAWWEDDNNVPAEITRTAQINLLERRLARLRRSRF